MLLEYMYKLIGTISPTIIQEQSNIIAKYERWSTEYQERSKSATFWDSALKGLDTAEAANILFIVSRLGTIIEDMGNISQMNSKERSQAITAVKDLVERLGRANETLK